MYEKLKIYLNRSWGFALLKTKLRSKSWHLSKCVKKSIDIFWVLGVAEPVPCRAALAPGSFSGSGSGLFLRLRLRAPSPVPAPAPGIKVSCIYILSSNFYAPQTIPMYWSFCSAQTCQILKKVNKIYLKKSFDGGSLSLKYSSVKKDFFGWGQSRIRSRSRMRHHWKQGQLRPAPVPQHWFYQCKHGSWRP